jgi:hypothetical protein
MADVQIVTPSGELGTVAEENLARAEELGAKLASPEQIAQGTYGGGGGQIATALLAGTDVASGGLGTALARQLGRMSGGKQGEIDTEIAIDQLGKSNPWAKIAGETLPLLVAPMDAEAGVPGLLEEMGVAQGKGAFDRAIRYSAPKFAQGALDMERIGIGEAISEAQLDPDKAAEAYWEHAGPGAALLGGVLNVGLHAGFKGVVSLGAEFGRIGDVAAQHSHAFEAAVAEGQKAGMTSDASNLIFGRIVGAASERANLAPEAKLYTDQVVADMIRTQSASPTQARQWTKLYKLSVDHNYTAEKVTAQYGIDIAKHATVLGGFERMANDIDFTFKAEGVRAAVEPRLLRLQADELIQLADTVEASMFAPHLPAEPRIPRFEPPPPPKGVSRDTARRIVGETLGEGPVRAPARDPGRSVGLDMGALEADARRAPAAVSPIEIAPGGRAALDPNVVGPFADARLPDPRAPIAIDAQAVAARAAETEYARMVQAAKGAHEEVTARIMAEHQASVQRILADHAAKADPLVRAIFGFGGEAVSLRAGISEGALRDAAGQVSKIRSRVKMATKLAEAGNEREAAVALHQTLDDVKRLFGRSSGFRKANGGTDLGEKVAEHFYEQLRWLGENPNVWGEKLASMQMDANAAFSFDGKRGVFEKALGALTDTLEKPGGRKLYRGNSEKATQWVKGLASDVAEIPSNSTIVSDFETMVDNVLARARQLKTHRELSPQQLEVVEQAVKSAEAMRKLVQDAHVDLQDFKNIDAMLAREGRSGIRGVIGTAINFAMNPGKRLQVLAGFRRVEQQVRGLIEKHAKGFIGKGERLPPITGPKTEAEKKVAYRMIEDVRSFRDNPAALGGRLKGLLGDVTMNSPVMTSAIATVAARAIMYLAQELPEPLPQRLTDKTTEPRYADSDIEQFWKKAQLVQKPTTALHRIQSGQFRHEDKLMLQSVFPMLYNDMKGIILTEIHTAREKGQLRTMTYQEQLLLTWFLDMPLDGTHKTDFLRTMQTVAQQDPNAQGDIGAAAQGGGRPRNVNINMERYETTVENLEK